MKYLVVVAHPDDEVLGAGASILKWTREGHHVAIAYMANHAAARRNRSSQLEEEQQTVAKELGIEKSYYGEFPNIKMNTVPHLELVQFVESCIRDFQAEVIVTHHPSDTNNDHSVTSEVVAAACRLSQRQSGVTSLKEVLQMEVLSATDWYMGSGARSYTPNYFVEIGEEGILDKLRILSYYSGVMREYPHPRSKESLRGLAAIRGSQSGCHYAESFECVFRRG